MKVLDTQGESKSQERRILKEGRREIYMYKFTMGCVQ